MGSLSGLLDTARNALLADQQAISVTGDNISNQNTAGYARRVVSWQENDTVSIGGLSYGTGSTVTVSAQRDRVLDQSVQQATDTASASSARLSALQNLQAIFTPDSSGTDSSGISTAISNFFAGIGTLATDPTSDSARASAYSAAADVVSTFQRAATAIQQQVGSLNQQVAADVQSVNQAAASIAALNGQIASAGPGGDADSLLDERNVAIESLSKLVGVQQTTASDGSVTLSAANGALLVTGSTSYAWSTAPVGDRTAVFAPGATGTTNVTAQVSGGSIGGDIAARDTDLANVAGQLDTLAYGFATAVNQQNLAGLQANGTAGAAIFSLPATTNGAAGGIALAASGGSSFAAASVTEGSGGNSNANALLALQNSAIVSGKTVAGAFAALIGGLGSTVASATSDSTADTASLTQLSTQRDNLSGVSLDEEAANLTQYQRSYQAAAKLLSVLNDLLATALNLGTDAPVSS